MSTRLRVVVFSSVALVATGVLLAYRAINLSETEAPVSASSSHAAGQTRGLLVRSDAAFHAVNPEEHSTTSDEFTQTSWPTDELAVIEALAASGDAKALTKLGALLQACSLVMGNEYTTERSARFDHSAWRPWLQSCSRERSARWSNLISSAPAHNSADHDVLAALTLDTDDPAELATRDRVIEDVLSQSDDPEAAAWAAYLYLDRTRQLAWAAGEMPHSMLLPEGSEAMRTEIAIAFACRVGRDCGSYAPQTVSECAATAGCLPGMSMRQIIELRRSQQELQFLDLMLRRLLEIRGRRE